jgi:hypothetical protein
VPAWTLRLPAGSAGALIPLRLCAGLEVGEHAAGGEIWLRGRSADPALAASLLTMPATARYRWLPDGRLQPHGAVLAVEVLPTLEWRPIQAWLHFVFPLVRPPAALPTPVSVELASDHAARAANAALLPLNSLLDWMRDAPALRLAPLRFAATVEGRALVLGVPLPSLSCRPCVEIEGVVVPAGLAWKPAVSARVVRRWLQVADDVTVLWDETGVHRLGTELFVSASRSTARATLRALQERGMS